MQLQGRGIDRGTHGTGVGVWVRAATDCPAKVDSTVQNKANHLSGYNIRHSLFVIRYMI